MEKEPIPCLQLCIEESFVRWRVQHRALPALFLVTTAMCAWMIWRCASGHIPDLSVPGAIGISAASFAMVGIASFLGYRYARGFHVLLSANEFGVVGPSGRFLSWDAENPLSVQKTPNGKVWRVRSGRRPRKVIRLPVAAYPALDLFVRDGTRSILTGKPLDSSPPSEEP